MRVVVNYSFADVDLIKHFEDIVANKKRSKLVELLIRNFTKLNKTERESILILSQSESQKTSVKRISGVKVV